MTRGANVFARNSRNKMALSIAQTRGHNDIATLLRTRMDALAAGTATPALLRGFSASGQSGSGSNGRRGGGPAPLGHQQTSADLSAMTEHNLAMAQALTNPQGPVDASPGGEERQRSNSTPSSPLISFSFYSGKVSRMAAAKALASVMGGGPGAARAVTAAGGEGGEEIKVH